MLDDIRDLAALQLRRSALEPIAFDPTRLVGEVVAEWRTEAAAKGVELALNVDELPERVVADRRRLRKVIEHVLRAVVRGTSAKHVGVEADADASAEMLRLVVRDDRRPARRGASDAAPAEVAATLARGLAAAMGGSFRSRRSSAGETVSRIVIPYATAPAKDAEVPVRLRGAAPREVLIVDEAPQQREAMHTLLAARGHRPVACARIDDAVRFLAANPVDVVIIAVSAFDSTTRTALGHLRLAAGDHAIPMLAAASCPDPGEARWDGARGPWDAAVDFDAVLEMPLDWDQLDDLLAELGGRTEGEPLIDAHMMSVITARLGGNAGRRLAVEFVVALGALVRSARESHAAHDRAGLDETLETMGGLAATFGCLPIVAAVRSSRTDSPTMRLARVLEAIADVFPKLGAVVAVETATA